MSTEARGSKLYVLVPLRAAMAAGVDVGPHLKACGINLDAVGAEQDAWFTREAVHELWFRLAEAVGDPVWGLHIAEAQADDPSAFGVIEYAARNSRDLGDALERVGRYARLMHDGIDVVWTRDPAVGATLAYRISDAKHGHNRFAAEWAITSWVLRGRRYVGRDFAPTEVSFKHAAPADLSEYQRIFGGPVRFGAAYPGLTIAEEHLRLPVTGADLNLLRVLETHARELVERLPEHDSVESRVRTYLATALSSGGDGSMAGVAAALGVSERALQRELKEKGTTLREVVDDCQRQIALAMVERTDLPDKEMSFLLGFTEPGSFLSAFRRWTQKSPLELRRKIPSYRSRDPIGLLKELQTDPIAMFMNMRAEHGDIVEASVGHLQGVFLFAPEDVEHVLVTNVKNYQRKEARSYKPLKQFLGAGLVTSEGELHQKQRKLIQPAFHRRQISSFFGSMRRHAEDLVESWRPRAQAGEEIDVTKGIYAMTLGIIGETMLGADLREDAEALGEAAPAGGGEAPHRTGARFEVIDVELLVDAAREHAERTIRQRAHLHVGHGPRERETLGSRGPEHADREVDRDDPVARTAAGRHALHAEGREVEGLRARPGGLGSLLWQRHGAGRGHRVRRHGGDRQQQGDGAHRRARSVCVAARPPVPPSARAARRVPLPTRRARSTAGACPAIRPG